MKRIGLILALYLGVFSASRNVFAQAFTESFNDITTLAGSGWVYTNNSSPIGLMANWFQGTSIVGGGPFDSYAGPANAYIAANYNFTSGNNTIDGWLMCPTRTLRNGDVLTFYTRKPTGTDYPDRIEVRMSANGASTNTGTTGSVGDFSTLLLSINPALAVGVYPTTWTLYTVTVSGLTAPTSGRLAFRYFVTGGGPTGSNSDYIGIDEVNYTPYVCPPFIMTPSGTLTGAVAGSPYSYQFSLTGALGAPNYYVASGSLPPGLNLSTSGGISGTPTATGTFNFSVVAADASGCYGSQSYTITVTCPSNPIVFGSSPLLCSNGSDYQLIEGSPSGGTYSGTGVQGGAFDPSLGTQTITYDYTDPYGCAHFSNYVINVNTAPTVTHNAVTPICSDNGLLNLSGGTPSGGVYSGTGVNGSNFDPSVGSQQITYTYSDANGCIDSVAVSIVVNDLPIVDFVANPDFLCTYSPSITLVGNPIGGTFSGSGITTDQFNPATAGVGSHTIVYSYTDVNGCSNETSDAITVDACLGLTEETIEGISIYPNPGSGDFHFLAEQLIEILAINDVNGRAVPFQKSTNSFVLLGVDRGVYFVRISVENQSKTLRLIVK